MSPSHAPSERTRIRRLPQRGSYDRTIIDAILDEALICHVGLVQGEQPFVIPTIHWRRGDELYIHGSAASRMLEHGGGGAPLCVTVTLVDGIVLARSAFHHSMNYRSVVILARARVVSERAEKLAAFNSLIERFAPGRSAHARPPNELELKATLVLVAHRRSIGKSPLRRPERRRSGPSSPIWAGVVPVQLAVHPEIVAEPSVPGLSAPRLGLGLAPMPLSRRAVSP